MNIGKLITKNINIILIISIIILIAYLVTSNEKFTIRRLPNTQEVDSNFDFVRIYNLIVTNLNSLNEITNQEREAYNEIVANIEIKQNEGYVFDIDYIRENITIEENTPATSVSTSTSTAGEQGLELFKSISIPKVSIPGSTQITTIKSGNSIEKFINIPSSIYDPNGCGNNEQEITVGSSNDRVLSINGIPNNIIAIKTTENGNLVRVNRDFRDVSDKFSAEIIQQSGDNKTLRITRGDGVGWGMNLKVCGILDSQETNMNSNVTVGTTTTTTTTGTTTTTTNAGTTTTTNAGTTTTRQLGSPNGYILLSNNQIRFLRYFVFLSIIRGIFDQLNKVNNYYFDPSGVDNNKFINMECRDDRCQVQNINNRDVITSFIMGSTEKGFPSITSGESTSSLPNVNVNGRQGLLNIYIDVIQEYINVGLDNDSVMKKILSISIDGTTNLREEIVNIVNDLIRQCHTYGLYYDNGTEGVSSYNFTLTI